MLPWPEYPSRPAPSPARTVLLHGNTQEVENEMSVWMIKVDFPIAQVENAACVCVIVTSSLDVSMCQRVQAQVPKSETTYDCLCPSIHASLLAFP